jgi:hypothetical protein
MSDALPGPRLASGPGSAAAGVFAGVGAAPSLWPHQERALRAFSADEAAGDRSTYLVVPPGGGKTMIGLECARQAGRPTLVLCPNTAIQAQWIEQWHARFAPPAQARATASRDLPTALTVLTYQAVAAFDPVGDAVAASYPGRRLADRELLDSLHPNGQRLLATLVACAPDTARALAAWLREAAPDLAATASAADVAGVATVSGGAGWQPRRYVPLVTRFFTEGGTRALVGTRALLGEGWDAPAVNVTVDLTAATTPTSVVQARGRALRRDSDWPEKVADNWAVVCVTDQHPKGAADYDRFVRKHDRYFALAATGDIASGVSHVDPGLSPFEPPAVRAIAELNARMLIRAGDRASSRELWRLGEPYADEPVATVVVASGRPLGLGRAAVPAVFDDADVTGLAAGQPAARRHGPVTRAFLAAMWFVLGVTARRARAITEAPASGSFADMAAATADALRDTGLVTRGAAGLRIEPLPDGEYRARLTGGPAAESATFAAALDEVLSPLAHPRYIVPRLFIAAPADRRAARKLARGAAPGPAEDGGRAATVVYHAVPSVLGGNVKLARAFAAAWNARVSPGEMLYTGAPEGAGILVVQRGDDPFDVTTQIRTLWH